MSLKKYYSLLFASQLLITTAFSQKLRTFKDHCGLYYTSMKDLLKQKAREVEFYRFQPGQNVASIGAQCCNWEAAYAATTDSVSFYLEDIDTSKFNARQAEFAWKYYAILRGRPMSSSYQLITGEERKTELPADIFDKILIINSFHEFSYKKEMLGDIAKKLKREGILFIDETLAVKAGDVHHGCGKPIYLDGELISVLKENGFDYVDGLVMNFRKSNPVRKIFAFKKTADVPAPIN